MNWFIYLCRTSTAQVARYANWLTLIVWLLLVWIQNLNVLNRNVLSEILWGEGQLVQETAKDVGGDTDVPMASAVLPAQPQLITLLFFQVGDVGDAVVFVVSLRFDRRRKRSLFFCNKFPPQLLSSYYKCTYEQNCFTRRSPILK